MFLWSFKIWNISLAFLCLSWHWWICGEEAGWFLEYISICLIFLNFQRALKELYKFTVSPAFPFSLEILIYSNFCLYHYSKSAFFQVISDLHGTKFSGQFSVLLSNHSAEFVRIHLLLLFEHSMLSSLGFLHITISFISFFNDVFFSK